MDHSAAQTPTLCLVSAFIPSIRHLVPQGQTGIGQFGSGFGRSNLNPETILITVVILASVVVISVGYVLARKYVFRPRPPSFGRIQDPRIIEDILATALSLRSRMEMAFYSKTGGRRHIYCSLAEYSLQHILLELPATSRPDEKWIGRHVTCYFRIQMGKQHPMFYNFSTSIEQVSKNDQGLPIIFLTRPSVIELGQKRQHLRIDPPVRLLHSVILWPAVRTRGYALQGDVRQWPQPISKLKPESHELVVRDISAGGIRLELDRKSVKDLEAAKGQEYFLRLALNVPDQRKPLILFLAGSLVNLFDDIQDSTLTMGLQFSSRGTGGTPEHPVLTWKDIKPEDGVEELGNWVLRRHLELYREKGLV